MPTEKGAIKVSLAQVQEMATGKPPVFPKYTRQLMNLANRTVRATGPKVVGQLTELVPKAPRDYPGWVEWYLREKPDAIEDATDRLWNQIIKYQAAAGVITKDMVQAWVTDLVLPKTYVGMMTQQAVLDVLATEYHIGPVRRATPEDEARGIDGYLGEEPVSIKPSTYRAMVLPETIRAPIIYYEKTETHLVIDASQLVARLNRE